MAARLADLIGMTLDRSIASQGLATIALSGGSTPEALYRALSCADIDWSNVAATLADERMVPPTDAASNEGFIRQALVKNRAAALRFVGLWNDAPDLSAAARAATARVFAMAPPFDVVVLGMGADGHTASWFPNADGLAAALADGAALVAPVHAKKSDATGPILERLTLSLAAVRTARLIILMMTGEGKRATFDKALRPGPVEEMPVRAILSARPDLWACWAP